MEVRTVAPKKYYCICSWRGGAISILLDGFAFLGVTGKRFYFHTVAVRLFPCVLVDARWT